MSVCELAEIAAQRSALNAKDYYVDLSGGRPKDANPKGQKSSLTKKKTTEKQKLLGKQWIRKTL